MYKMFRPVFGVQNLPARGVVISLIWQLSAFTNYQPTAYPYPQFLNFRRSQTILAYVISIISIPLLSAFTNYTRLRRIHTLNSVTSAFTYYQPMAYPFPFCKLSRSQVTSLRHIHSLSTNSRVHNNQPTAYPYPQFRNFRRSKTTSLWHTHSLFTNSPLHKLPAYTDQKENQISLIYKEIQSGVVAKLYMRKGFLIYEEMRKYFPIYEAAVRHI
jgi:hypothetical protein